MASSGTVEPAARPAPRRLTSQVSPAASLQSARTTFTPVRSRPPAGVKCSGSTPPARRPTATSQSTSRASEPAIPQSPRGASTPARSPAVAVSSAGAPTTRASLETAPRPTAIPRSHVSGLTKGVTALAVGSTDDYLPTHTCALASAGGVKCWGPNGDGQLGDDSRRTAAGPVEVSGLTSGIVAIAVGGSHTCAITKERGLKCWGDNSNGQLGDGSSTNSPTPVDVVGL